MTHKYSSLMTGLFLITTQFAFAQNHRDLMNEGQSFDQIVQQMETRHSGSSFKKGTTGYSREYKQYMRWKNFWKNRLMPDGSFPSAQQFAAAWTELEPKQASKTAAANWKYFGPKDLPQSNITFYPGMGRVNAVAVNPGNHKIIIVGAASSGIWKSTDKGLNWDSKTENLPNIGISDLVIDPNNSNIIYAATGDADFGRSPYSTGVLKSTDGGDTWSIIGLGTSFASQFSIKRMAMPPSPSNTIIATTSSGIQRSTDGGVTWNVVSTDNSGYDIEQKPNDNNVFFVGTSSGTILRSTDGGGTWADITPAAANFSGRVELGVTPADNDFIVAIDAAGTIMRSTDGGGTWFPVSGPQFDSQGGYNMTVAISPNDKDKILLGGIHGWRSTDGGSTWEKYLDGYWEQGDPYFYVHSDHHDWVFMPGGSDTLMVANDGGLYYGDINQSTAYTDISKGLFITQYYGIGILRTDTTTVIGGTQDNDGVFINSSGAKGMLPGSDGWDGLIDYSNPQISYAASTGSAPEKTTDGWQNSTALNPPGFFPNWDVPMAMNPVNPSSVYFAGGANLVNSPDGGNNWNTLYQSSSFGEITELTIAPSDSNIIVLYDGQLQRTSNHGTSWSALTSPSSEAVTGIAIHPTNPNTIYVTVGGFNAGDKAFMTTDAGQSWTNITHDLPNIPVNHVVYANGTNDHVYIATDLGVYINKGGATTWATFNSGLPYTQVMELEINYTRKTLFAATYGRGIWKSQLEQSISISESPKLGFEVYPTTSNGIFTLELETNEAHEVTVFNAIGGVVYHKELRDLKNHIDLSGAVPAAYFISVKRNNSYDTRKIFIRE